MKVLFDKGAANRGGHFHGETKMVKAAVAIEVLQDGASNTVASVDVVTAAVGSRNGDLFFIASKVIPEIVEGNGLVGVSIFRGNPGIVIEAVVHEIAHIGPPIVGMYDDSDEVFAVMIS